MKIEGERDGLPDRIRERVEIVESARLLREDCVEILSSHGTLNSIKGISRIKRRVNEFLDHPFNGRTREEMLNRRIYKTSLDVGRARPVEITILSLGTTIRDPKDIIIYIPELLSNKLSLAINRENEPRMLIVETKKDPNKNRYHDPLFVEFPKIDMNAIRRFSNAISLVKKNLPQGDVSDMRHPLNFVKG